MVLVDYIGIYFYMWQYLWPNTVLVARFVFIYAFIGQFHVTAAIMVQRSIGVKKRKQDVIAFVNTVTLWQYLWPNTV
jgi:hypothetical protein